MQSTGQASTQAVSFVPMQGSAITYAMDIIFQLETDHSIGLRGNTRRGAVQSGTSHGRIYGRGDARRAASHGGTGEGGQVGQEIFGVVRRAPAGKGAKTSSEGKDRATARSDRGHSYAQVVWAGGAGESGARMRGGSLESEARS